jgi:hypothetical protein
MNGFSAIGSGSGAVQNAQLGISRGMANLSRDAQVIAQGSVADNGNAMTGALIDAQVQKLSVEASARVLSIADQTLGTLLDIKA